MLLATSVGTVTSKSMAITVCSPGCSGLRQGHEHHAILLRIAGRSRLAVDRQVGYRRGAAGQVGEEAKGDLVQRHVLGVRVAHLLPARHLGQAVVDAQVQVIDAGAGLLLKRSLLAGDQAAAKGRAVVPVQVEEGGGGQRTGSGRRRRLAGQPRRQGGGGGRLGRGVAVGWISAAGGLGRGVGAGCGRQAVASVSSRDRDNGNTQGSLDCQS